MDDLSQDLSEIKTSDLKKMLSDAIRMTREGLQQLAFVWRELDRRNALTIAERAQFKHGLISFIPLIANNKLEPDLLLECAGQKKLLDVVSVLPIVQQKELVQTGEVKVVNVFDDHKTLVSKKLTELSSREINQVFGDGHIRTIPEQLKFIAAQRIEKDAMPAYREARYIAIEKNNLIVSNMYIDIPRVLKELSKHFKIDLEKFLKSKGKLK